MRFHTSFLVILLFYFPTNQVFAQSNGSAIKLFFEKVYLHIDRMYYAPGDDIWFKAYLVNAQSNYLFNTSNNIYVELINPVNKIISREVIRLDNGIGSGDFKLLDSIEGGNYVFLIYLELRPGAFNTDPSFIHTDITGYYEARSFYSPNYQSPEKSKPDERTTIYWAPNITTNKNGEAAMSFYNADPATTIKVDVQGLTDKGIPIAAVAGYEVKER